MADTSLHLSAFDLPLRRTVSLAQMRLHSTGFAGFFQPWAGPTFASEDIALCGRAEDHDAPGADCNCGFRAADDPHNLLDLINPPMDALAGAALLDVELGGIVLPMGPGFRGSSQRVVRAGVLRWCRTCLVRDRASESPPQLYGIHRSDWLNVVALCDEHAMRLSHRVALTPAEVADHLRAPVVWAGPRLAESVRLHLERRWAMPQLVGPPASERRVSSLRMGQLGFVPAPALRLDGRGMLRLRSDAPAPQRPMGEAVIPVRRTVDLHLEMLATTPEVHRLDARLALSRPPLLGVREEHVARIRGLRHLPRLASVVRL